MSAHDGRDNLGNHGSHDDHGSHDELAGPAGTAGHRGHAGLEIERTFLLTRMPSIPVSVERIEIEQGYLPSGGEIEGRVRRETLENGEIRCTHTVKRGMGLIRDEDERSITRSEFERAWPATKGRRLRKTRYRAPFESLTWEIDRFHDLPPIEGRSLVMAEVEIPPTVRPETIEIPPWIQDCLVREVTDEPRFRNYALAASSGTI